MSAAGRNVWWSACNFPNKSQRYCLPRCSWARHPTKRNDEFLSKEKVLEEKLTLDLVMFMTTVNWPHTKNSVQCPLIKRVVEQVVSIFIEIGHCPVSPPLSNKETDLRIVELFRGHQNRNQDKGACHLRLDTGDGLFRYFNWCAFQCRCCIYGNADITRTHQLTCLAVPFPYDRWQVITDANVHTGEAFCHLRWLDLTPTSVCTYEWHH